MVRDAFFFPALSVAIALVAVGVLSRGSNGGDSHPERERERVWECEEEKFIVFFFRFYDFF